MTAALRIRRRGSLPVAALVVVFLWLAPPAGAFIYWAGPNADGTASRIERANLDGSKVRAGFIPTGRFGPDSIAVDSRHVYWANGTLPDYSRGVGSIARANVSGSGANEHLIWTYGSPGGIAVRGGYLYWGQSGGIWRARTAGGRPQAVVAGPHRGHTYYPFAPNWLAADRTHLYWGDQVGRIGRANLNGSHAVYGLVRSVNASGGIAVAGGRIYWLSTDGRIGRAKTNGSGARRDFISTGLPGGQVTPCGLAAYGGQIYWLASTSTGDTQGTIGRARLNGSGLTAGLITVGFGCGLAVDGRGA